MRPRLVSLNFFLALACCVLVACTGQSGKGSGGSGGSQTTATIMLSLKAGTTTTTSCSQYQIVWKAEPLNLTGPDGITTAVVKDKLYTARLEPEGGGFRCYFDESIVGLKTGTWRISYAAAGNSASCDQALGSNGVTLIHFTVGRQGCTVGQGYPG